MDDVWAYLTRRLVGDLAAWQTQAVCVGVVALFTLFVWWNKNDIKKANLTFDPMRFWKGGQFVFSEELGKWPVVYQYSSQSYFIYAPHFQPFQSGFASKRISRKMLVRFALLIIVLFFFSFVGVIAAVIACSVIMRKWPEEPQSHPAITIKSNIMDWVSPNDGIEKVALDSFKMRVQVPHRKASAEARQHERIMKQEALERDNAIRRVSVEEQRYQEDKQDALRRGQKSTPQRLYNSYIPDPSPPNPIYQTASELIIITGASDQIWKVMAEFGPDEHGEQANELYHAINLVRNACLQERATQVQLQPASLSGPIEAFE